MLATEQSDAAATSLAMGIRDPVSGRIRTDGRITPQEAARYPGAMRIPALSRSPRSPHEPNDFEDTQAGTFHTTSTHID